MACKQPLLGALWDCLTQSFRSPGDPAGFLLPLLPQGKIQAGGTGGFGKGQCRKGTSKAKIPEPAQFLEVTLPFSAELMERAPQAPARPRVLPRVCASWKLERIGRAPPSREPTADVASSLGPHGDNVGASRRARAGERPAMPDCQRDQPPAGPSLGALWGRGLEGEQRGPHEQVSRPPAVIHPEVNGPCSASTPGLPQ